MNGQNGNGSNGQNQSTSAERASEYQRLLANALATVGGDGLVHCTHKGCGVTKSPSEAVHVGNRGFCSPNHAPQSPRFHGVAVSIERLTVLAKIESENAAEVARLQALDDDEAAAERPAIEEKIADAKRPVVAKREEFAVAEAEFAKADEAAVKAKKRFDAVVSVAGSAFAAIGVAEAKVAEATTAVDAAMVAAAKAKKAKKNGAEAKTATEAAEAGVQTAETEVAAAKAAFTAAQTEVVAAKETRRAAKTAAEAALETVTRIDREGLALRKRADAELDRLYERLHATPRPERRDDRPRNGNGQRTVRFDPRGAPPRQGISGGRDRAREAQRARDAEAARLASVAAVETKRATRREAKAVVVTTVVATTHTAPAEVKDGGNGGLVSTPFANLAPTSAAAA
ncbi:MAG: hypothetical protein V1723_02705 [Candidatus Uhrbacteria bacterium]